MLARSNPSQTGFRALPQRARVCWIDRGLSTTSREASVSSNATGETPVAPLTVRPLDTDTWPAFARLVEANNGVWGGCWCMGFHVKVGKGRTPQQNRAEKKQRVREGRAHAALVFEGDNCLGGCHCRIRRCDSGCPRAGRRPKRRRSTGSREA